MNRFVPLRTYRRRRGVPSCSIAAESRPRPRLGQRVGRQPLAGGESRNVAALLLLACRESSSGDRAERLDREDQAGRRADLRQLLDRDEQHQRAGAGATVRSWNGQRKDLRLTQRLDDVPGKLPRRVDLGRPRRHPLRRDLADEVAQLPLIVREPVVRHALIVGAGSHPARSHPHPRVEPESKPATRSRR